MGQAEVDAEVARLCAELREARIAQRYSTRETADLAGINLGTLFRLEQGRTRPTFTRFARVAATIDVQLEYDADPKPRRFPPRTRWPVPPGYRYRPVVVEAGWDEDARWWHERLHYIRVRLGAELWWARQQELVPPLDAEAACRLLGMSHHTLVAVESGPGWPDLASIVRAAGLTGRRLVLAARQQGLPVPPWATAE